MLSDILSRLVETIAEQGEDMQGYVTELFLTLEAVVDALDSDFKPMDMSRCVRNANGSLIYFYFKALLILFKSFYQVFYLSHETMLLLLFK